MNSSSRRQIKDIQFRAERLVNDKVTLNDIIEFNQYNEELKKYLIESLKDPELIERVKQIPKILEEIESQTVSRNIITNFLLIFAPSMLNYFQDKQKIEDAKEYIREARGKYASIEFLLKAYQE